MVGYQLSYIYQVVLEQSDVHSSVTEEQILTKNQK